MSGLAAGSSLQHDRFDGKAGRPNFRFWRELAGFSLLAMGLSWVVPWFRSLSQATYEIPPAMILIVLGGFGGAAYVSAKWLAALHIQMKYRQRAMLLLLLASIFLGLKLLLYAKDPLPLSTLVMRPLWAIGNFSSLIPNEFLVIMAVLFAWRRGAVLALDYVGPDSVQRDFKIGFAMFLLFVVFNTLVTGETIEFSTLLFFFFFGLLAMGAARMTTVGELRGGIDNTFDRKRLIGVLFGTISAVALAYWAGVLMGSDGAVLAAVVIGLIVIGTLLLSIPFLIAILYVIFWLLLQFQDELSPGVEKFFDSIGRFVNMLTQLAQSLRETAQILAEKFAFLAPIFIWLKSLAPLVRLAVLGGSMLVVIGLILLAFYIRERRRRLLLGAAHDSVLSLEDFLRLLQDALKRRLQNAAASLANAVSFQGRRRLWAAARIRRIYMQLLELCLELGTPRPQAATPSEFAATLEKVFPGHAPDLHMITEAYQRVRYGELPEGRTEIELVEEAWKVIRAQGEEIKKMGAHPLEKAY